MVPKWLQLALGENLFALVVQRAHPMLQRTYGRRAQKDSEAFEDSILTISAMVCEVIVNFAKLGDVVFTGDKQEFVEWVDRLLWDALRSVRRKAESQNGRPGEFPVSPEFFEQFAALDLPEMQAQIREIRKFVQSALSKKQGQIVDDFFWQHKQLNEIAADMEVPYGTIKTWFKNAITRLKERFEEHKEGR